jgi:cytochrome d ubiquinol oxidase subunit I
LEEFPRANWPPITIVHIAFQIMVAAGFAMAGVSLWGGWRLVRRRSLTSSRPFLWGLVLTAPLGFVAIEAGWVVTEVGRQPWIIQGVVRTADAVTPMRGLIVPFVTFTVLYVVLAALVVWLLFRDVASTTTVSER